MAGPAGFEPATSGLEGSLNEIWAKERSSFIEWLSGEVGKETKKDYVKALDKFFGRHTIKTLRDLESAFRKEGQKRCLAKALRKFAGYLEKEEIINENTYEKIKKLIKLKPVGVREVFISDDEVRKAYLEVKKRGIISKSLFLLLVFSGIRLSQAVELLRTYDYTKLQIINEKAAKYPIFSMTKGKKKAFWAYGPLDFFEELEPWNVKYNTAKDLVRYRRVSANTLRKWHYTFLIRQGVPADIADFIQGRTSERVGATHYLNKTLLADEWYSAVVDKLKKILEGDRDD
ncbi:integrase [Thermococcus sp.]|uniref:integrase n=1 Tax=Thermococcus sp. TaxID=35749 RepID=UPI00262E3174|nr:integrase [Thermococcus sp.]